MSPCTCPTLLPANCSPPATKWNLYRQKSGAAVSCTDASSHTGNRIWTPLQAFRVPNPWLLLPYSTFSFSLLTPCTLKFLLFLQATRFQAHSEPLSTTFAWNILPSVSCLAKLPFDFRSQQKWSFLKGSLGDSMSTLPSGLFSCLAHENFCISILVYSFPDCQNPVPQSQLP